MPQDRAAVPARHPGRVALPDQVQQARRPDEPRKAEAKPERTETEGGVLHELQTQRAHD